MSATQVLATLGLDPGLRRDDEWLSATQVLAALGLGPGLRRDDDVLE